MAKTHSKKIRTKCGLVDMTTTTITIKIGGDDDKDAFKENQKLVAQD
jgi:hypothetical protein